MKLTRHYLTADEIGAIVYEMLKDNEITDEKGNVISSIPKEEYQRQMVKYGIIAQFLIDGLEMSDEKTMGDYYTDAISNGIDLDIEVVNIDLIDKIVDKELGLARTIEGILDGVVNNIDEQMKTIDPKSLILELGKLQKV